jgi:sugar phosphate isomerase/epimerase
LPPYAAESDVRLVLEPLHPMYAADRAVLSTLGQALDLAAPYPARTVGVLVDTFHVWWDPELAAQVARAGREDRIASYQVCDFNLPIAADPVLSRGMMGDGVIDFPAITRMIDETGYARPVEVEIFNADIWAAPADEVLDTMAQRWPSLVLPSLGSNPLR